MDGQTPVIVAHDHHDHHMHCHTKNVSWGAIFVGALTGFGLMFLLDIFSISIGLTVFPATQDGSISLAVGGLLGVMIGLFISMFVAGWVAGCLGRPYCHKRNLGVMYGFTTWCLTLILTMLLASHIGHFIVSYSRFITNPTTIMLTGNQAMPIDASQYKPTHMILSFAADKSSIAIGALVVFILLATGAIGSCFGGHYGMVANNDKDHSCC